MDRQRIPAANQRLPRTNLPVRREPLIGREQDVATLRCLLLRQEVGLVTLTGAGGTGKTRLALQVAADLLDQLRDGVYFVPLSSIRNPELITSAIAHVIGVEEVGEQSLAVGLQTYLRERQTLLLLDNFEQLLDAAPIVSELLSTCEGLTVLVTSRVRLRISGEYEFPVQPLALPDLGQPLDPANLVRSAAIALFLQRAQTVRPDFSLTSDNAMIVAEICARLDGLPLALELAAARLKILPPDTLLKRLGNRLNLLTGGPRDLPAHQQTLRDTIAWSYELLTPEEQRLFRRLAPLVGGFLLDAAEALSTERVGEETGLPASADLDMLDGITSLVDKSLLRPTSNAGNEPRFAMLETIREYAQERLRQSGEEQAIHARHARFYLDLIETAEPGFFGGKWTDLIARLEAEHDNFRAALQSALNAGETELALRLAGALAWFWYDHGHLSEGRRWLDTTLAVAEAAPPAMRAKALIGAGGLAHRQYDLHTARQQLEAGLDLSRALNDDWSTALALINLGLVIHDQGDYALARRLHEESLALCRAAKNTWGIGTSLSNLAWSALFASDLERAWSIAQEALALRRQLNDQLGLAYTLYTLGRIALARGNEPKCRDLLRESVNHFHELGERWGLAACLETLAIADADPRHGQPGALRAARFWSAAERLRETIGAPLTPADRPVHERHQRNAQIRVDPNDWNVAWNAGRSLSLDEILAGALESTAPATVAAPRAGHFPAGLTAREVEVLQLVADGLSNSQVADRLSLSPRTIGQHLRSIYDKLGVNSRTAAARFAIEHNLL